MEMIIGIGGLYSVGAVLCFRKGREAFEKSRGSLLCSCRGKCRARE